MNKTEKIIIRVLIIIIIAIGAFIFFTSEETLEDIYGVSPHRELLKLQNIFQIDTENPQEEYIIIGADRNIVDSIDISKWKLLRMSDGMSFTIPFGTNLPQDGGSSIFNSILVNGDDRLVISSGRSPIGLSFRVNLCSGYDEQIFTFLPPLKQECPIPEDVFFNVLDNETLLDENCLSFIREVPQCIVPFTHHSDPSLSESCKEFIDQNLNKNGCVDNFSSSPSFLQKEWRIYLDSKRCDMECR